MAGFVKVYDTILRSSVWLEDQETRIVWITMLVLADADGIVHASVGGLAHQARVPLESCRKALATLAAPDADDRSGVDEGRRIRPVQGGWFLLNHRRYRETRSAEQVATAERVRRWRERQAAPALPVTLPNVTTPGVTAEAEAEADPVPDSVGSSNLRSSAAPRASARTTNGHETVLTAYRAAYRERYGREPPITAADRSQVGRLLQGARPADVAPPDWPARLAELATAYVRDKEAFVAKAGHPLRLLSTRLSALRGGPATPLCRRCKAALCGDVIEGCHMECYR